MLAKVIKRKKLDENAYFFFRGGNGKRRQK